MLDRIDLFKTAFALARHSGARQATIAENIANADTPGYKAKDLQPFSASAATTKDASQIMVATRSEHLAGAHQASPINIIEARGRSTNPNENSVSLQEEMLFAVEAKRGHDRALEIYKSGLRILRSSLGAK
ncbi:MAG: FlgB family protein [Spiribacter salinus]|uniref:FlgB family protein n=1 Tax=Spiribacter salinus TaxID=1335746 RepID=A0A540VVS4_9GAMM|nr:MAG: FlgB family protein [Spiribacter salinus]